MAVPYAILERKRAGGKLSEDEIRAAVRGAVDGSWTEGQLAAFLMAVAIRGFDVEETRALTLAMLESGERWDLAEEVPLLCDKHSTGGVGDKVSLVLSPILAACGLPVVMLTGRGLGHTGGTADKLETIPGLDLALDRGRTLELLGDVGMAIGMATARVAPADRTLYALRDTTGTVASVPLVTASILSKKLATGAAALVFDVKSGDGAFLRDPREAAELARRLVETAGALGQASSALVTDMSQPLGRWVGHTAELRETLECLAGDGPDDLMEVTYRLCEEVSDLAGRPLERETLRDAVGSGRARETFERWVEAQGGEAAQLDACARELAPLAADLTAERGGYLRRMHTRELGLLLVEAGAGRRRPDDRIDTGVALHCPGRLGQRVERGDVLARLYLREADESLVRRCRECFEVGAEPAEPPPLIGERIA